MTAVILPYDLGLFPRRRIKRGMIALAQAFGCSITFHDDKGFVSAVGIARIVGDAAPTAACAMRQAFNAPQNEVSK